MPLTYRPAPPSPTVLQPFAVLEKSALKGSAGEGGGEGGGLPALAGGDVVLGLVSTGGQHHGQHDQEQSDPDCGENSCPRRDAPWPLA